MQQGKRAIVVGASSGIGLEVAKLLIKEGWTVGVAARRVELLQGIGAAASERIDVTANEATEAFQRLIRNTGGMDSFFDVRSRKKSCQKSLGISLWMLIYI